MKIEFIRLSENAIIPTYGREGDAGLDLYTAKDMIIKPHETIVIPTDIAMSIPMGYEGQVRPRSGNSLNGVKGCHRVIPSDREHNSKVFMDKNKKTTIIPCDPQYLRVQLGTIDSNYTGNIGIITYNQEDYTVIIPKHTKLAQLVIAPVAKAELIEVDILEKTERGDKGFGSSDREV